MIERIKSGEWIYKTTKPDLQDNLNKLPFDVCEGIIYTNDSRVCTYTANKIYGFNPRTELTFYKID